MRAFSSAEAPGEAPVRSLLTLTCDNGSKLGTRWEEEGNQQEAGRDKEGGHNHNTLYTHVESIMMQSIIVYN